LSFGLFPTAWLSVSAFPEIGYAWSRSPLLGLAVGVSFLFIAYFWLNGSKDVIYAAFYHMGGGDVDSVPRAELDSFPTW
jgi:hypothetical protein